jgi:hypothetical protein
MANTTASEGTSTNPSKHSIKGDLNHDGCVDWADMELFQETFGKKEGEPDFNPEADFNGDRIVNILDFRVMRANFGKGCRER